MLMKKPQYRKFDYTPRFYNPEKDEKEKLKRKLGFTRNVKVKRKTRSPIVWLFLVILVIIVLLKLAHIG